VCVCVCVCVHVCVCDTSMILCAKCVVNHETSQQIEASKNTFACKDTGKERVFRELPAIQTYHRYHHDVPSFLSRHAAYGNVT